MSFLREIEEVTEKSVIVALFTVSATVGVGTLTLYQFHLGFLNTLDWFHFTLLVISLPLPSLVANSIAMSYITLARDQLKEQEGQLKEQEGQRTGCLPFTAYSLACSYSVLTFAAGIFLSYCFEWRFRTFGVFMATMQVAIAVYAYCFFRWHVRTEKGEKPAASVEP